MLAHRDVDKPARGLTSSALVTARDLCNATQPSLNSGYRYTQLTGRQWSKANDLSRVIGHTYSAISSWIKEEKVSE